VLNIQYSSVFCVNKSSHGAQHTVFCVIKCSHSAQLCWALWEDLITQNTVCWAPWEDLFTQKTGEYCILSTVGRFIYTKYRGILYVEHCEKICLHNILRNTFMLSTMWRFIYPKYWGILCWALWEDLFTPNTHNTLC
jgi:hypothetical protein